MASTEARDKQLKLLMKILNNILENPDEERYRNLNLGKISAKLSQNYIHILYHAGFTKSVNGERLIFNIEKIDILQSAYYHLKFNLPPTNEIDTKLSKNAIKAPHTEKKNNTFLIPMDMDNSIKYLVDMGYSAEESLDAIIFAQYDINVAVNNLINGVSPHRNVSKATEHPLIPTTFTEKLTNMGFTKEQSIFACRSSSGNINNAIEILLQHDGFCYGSIKECKYLVQLLRCMEHLSDNDNMEIKLILNSFNHLILNHISSDEFKFILDKFSECDAKQCTIFKRYRRYREINVTSNTDEEKYVPVHQQIYDKIHCHFLHCYDIGYRVPLEIQNKKRCIKTNPLIEMNINKFNSLHNSHNNTNNIIPNKYAVERIQSYSFGQHFYYWEYFKNCQDVDMMHVASPNMRRYKDWYIKPKYTSLKQELINNSIVTINCQQWQNEYKKAMIYHRTNYCKTLIAETEPKWLIRDSTINIDTSLYGIKKGTIITINHLISIIIYCCYTVVSKSFSSTFRGFQVKTSDSSTRTFWNELKNKHSNFHHLGKYITEATNVFSKPALEGNIAKFYHGIDKKMLFDEMTCYMYQPFSTTSSWEVAVNFSNYFGIVLELNCDLTTRYFNCAWLSDFSNERELLFINCSRRLRFTNITDVQNVTNSDLQLCNLCTQSLSIIDRMARGHFYDNDNRAAERMVYSANNEMYQPDSINPSLKLLTIKLIKHELNKYLPQKYDKYAICPLYIDSLLHHLCTHRLAIALDITAMNTEILIGAIGGDDWKGGALGYRFLKDLFFAEKYGLIKFNVLTKLFPNAVILSIQSMPSISVVFLEAILKYLPSATIVTIMLQVDKNTIQQKGWTLHIDMMQLTGNYEQRFQNKGWNISYSDGIMTIKKGT